MSKKPGRWLAPAGAAAFALAIFPTAVRADVAPGDKITEQNIDKVKDLISPGMEWVIKHGWPITISETKRIEWPKAYKEATEKYASQVKLTPDLRNIDADTGAIADHGPLTVERHFLLDHFRRLFWTGRLYVDPKPDKPNPNGYRAQQGLYPILEPFDLKGVGALGNRYTSSEKQDDSWLYLPSLRRVRRLSTAQRSDALFGQDTDVDSYYGYSGHVAWMDFKFLGERDLLSCYHAEHYPVKWHDKVDWAFDEKWEKRRVYVIEGISKLPQYAYGKRVIFVDKEAWVIPFSDIYDRSGELWKIWLNDMSFKKKAFEGATSIEYPDEMGFIPAIVMVDMQLEHATKASLPSPRFPGEQGWYFNQGEKAGITDDWFNVSALVNAGH